MCTGKASCLHFCNGLQAPGLARGRGFVHPTALHQPRELIWESRCEGPCEWTGRGSSAVCVLKEYDQDLGDLHLSWT